MVGFEHFQLGNLHIQIHFFADAVVAGGKGFDLGVGKGGGVHILGGAGGAFGGHDLADKFLLVFHQPPVVSVECPFGDILEHFHRRIHVSLAQRTAGALLQIGRTPGAIEIVGRDNAVLHVRACAHFCRGAD